MRNKNNISITKAEIFNQKKTNHIVHYNDNFEVVLNILKNGFAPSYCEEVIGDHEYYIPMVSFCNIPLRDVNLYIRYGKYGIGMSLNWALRNSISPVVYIHENTTFKNIHSEINRIHLYGLINKTIDDKLRKRASRKVVDDNLKNGLNLIAEINKITVPAIQYFKNWKTIYKQNEIITYQEREWRYIPNLSGTSEKALISKNDPEFKQLEDKKFRAKPHLPNYLLEISDINDIKYIIIKSEEQRNKILKLLINKFDSDRVNTSIVSGNLLILKHETIHNDF